MFQKLRNVAGWYSELKNERKKQGCSKNGQQSIESVCHPVQMNKSCGGHLGCGRQNEKSKAGQKPDGLRRSQLYNRGGGWRALRAEIKTQTVDADRRGGGKGVSKLHKRMQCVGQEVYDCLPGSAPAGPLCGVSHEVLPHLPCQLQGLGGGEATGRRRGGREQTDLAKGMGRNWINLWKMQALATLVCCEPPKIGFIICESIRKKKTIRPLWEEHHWRGQ